MHYTKEAMDLINEITTEFHGLRIEKESMLQTGKPYPTLNFIFDYFKSKHEDAINLEEKLKQQTVLKNWAVVIEAHRTY